MKYKGFAYLAAFIALIMMVGLACDGATATSQAAATEAPPAPPSTSGSTDNTGNTGNTGTTGGGYTTFVDQNKYYQIDIPEGWTHSQTTDKQNNYYYIDTFSPPDKNALIENIAYDDGTAFSGSDNGRFALYLLNTFYSKTGKEGDIRVSDDSIQKDGSERLTWSSKSGGYSGISYFEIRNRTTFLMFTVEWSTNAKEQYFDTLDHVITSYATP